MNDYQTFITEGAKNLKPMNAKELAEYAINNVGKIIEFADDCNELGQGEGWYGLVTKIGEFDNPYLMLDYYGGGCTATYSLQGKINQDGDLFLTEEDKEYIEFGINDYFKLWDLDTVYVEIREKN